MGGATVNREEMPVQLAKNYNDKLNTYGEVIGYEIFGIMAGETIIPTRIYEWRIEWKSKESDANKKERLFFWNTPVTFNELKTPLPETVISNFHPLEFCQ